jgi:phage terminase Nu1 subunit (DNA packaging protein)
LRAAEALDRAGTQAELAELLGVSEARVSQMVGDGLVEKGDTLLRQLRMVCQHLREVAAGRMSGEVGGLDLVQERAALAREQRIAQELKNQIARGEYAPIGLLADCLGRASSAVVDRFDQLEGALSKTCPDLPDEALQTLQRVLAGARNVWITETAKLMADDLAHMVEEPETDEADAMAPGFDLDDDKGAIWVEGAA